MKTSCSNLLAVAVVATIFGVVTAQATTPANETFSSGTTNANLTGIDAPLDSWVLEVICDYPINGTYSLLNRILYYVLLVFALVVHHHEWLVAGALGAATTYSGAAAVQSMVQFHVASHLSDSGGDNDNEAIWGILAAGLLIAVPLIKWSRTLRRLQARPLIIYWAIVILVGYILVLRAGRLTLYVEDARYRVKHMFCNTQSPLPHFQNLGFVGNGLIEQFNCTNPCSNNVDHPLFHSPSGSIPRLLNDLTRFYRANHTLSDLTQSAVVQCPLNLAGTADCDVYYEGETFKFQVISAVAYNLVLPFIIIQLLHTICYGRRSPRQIRNLIFTFFFGGFGGYKKGKQLMKQHERGQNRARVILSSILALCFYFTAVLIVLTCIPFFCLNIAIQEYKLRLFQDAEDPYENSQWLPWVAVGLTLIGAIIGRYHHSWRVALKRGIRHMINLFRKSNPSEKQKDPSPKQMRARQSSAIFLNTRSNRSGPGYIRFLKFLLETTRTGRDRVWTEYHDFIDFLRDPVKTVLRRHYNVENIGADFHVDHEISYPDLTDLEGGLRTFKLELVLSADKGTLESWKNWDETTKDGSAETCGKNGVLVYRVELPEVPKHPDSRPMVARSRVPTMKTYEQSPSVEKVDSVDENKPAPGPKLNTTSTYVSADSSPRVSTAKQDAERTKVNEKQDDSSDSSVTDSLLDAEPRSGTPNLTSQGEKKVQSTAPPVRPVMYSRKESSHHGGIVDIKRALTTKK